MVTAEPGLGAEFGFAIGKYTGVLHGSVICLASRLRKIRTLVKHAVVCYYDVRIHLEEASSATGDPIEPNVEFGSLRTAHIGMAAKSEP